MKYATKKNAKEIVDEIKHSGRTYYFCGELEMERMVETFRESGFGVDETRVIIAALVLAGAKFTVE